MCYSRLARAAATALRGGPAATGERTSCCMRPICARVCNGEGYVYGRAYFFVPGVRAARMPVLNLCRCLSA